MTSLTNALNIWLAAGDIASVREAVKSMHPADIANEMGGLPANQAAALLAALPPDRQGIVFGYFDATFQIAMTRALPRAELAGVVTAMSHDERADLWKRLDPLVRDALMPALAHAEREDIRRLAAYEEGTAGAVMTSDYVTVGAAQSVAEAVDQLRRDAPDAETIYEAYVLDDNRALIGVVSLRDLLLAQNDRKISDIMTRDVISAGVEDEAEAAARTISKYDLIALPVRDRQGALVGIITQDDAMDVAMEDASELMYKKAGLTSFPHATDVIRSEKLTQGGIWYPIRVRLLFLMVTLAGGLMVGGLIDHFEDVLASVVAVAVFVPLIMDMGGNVGTQSTTIFARGFALGHINIDRFWQYLRREVSIGLVLGLVMGLLAGVIAYFWQGVPNDVPQLGIAVGVALFSTVTLACALGFLLPYAMVKIGIDHAPGADPFITTIKDFSGLALYFILVAWLLGLDI